MVFKKIDLKIKGMHCKSCETLIKDELIESGAKDCKIDHKSGKATVTFDESYLNLNTIKSIIKKEGYEVI
jgi:copper chaperone CopZ